MHESPASRISAPNASDMAEIELRVAGLAQLFDALDPSPIETRDLDKHVDMFIVNSAKDLPRESQLGLVVHFINAPDDSAFVPAAIHAHFRRSAEAERRRLREHFRYGRIALCIGLSFLTFSLGASILAEQWLNFGGLGVVKESLGIAGWVAMWRPAEIFLYNWWPILAEAKLYERLATMPVKMYHPE